MSRYSRREFMGLGALLAAGGLEGQSSAQSRQSQINTAPDLVLVNG